MRKLFVIFCLLSIYAYGQCLSGPLSTRVGIKTGLVFSRYKVNGDDFTGTGFLIGLGMGTDIFGFLGIDLTPQYRSTAFGHYYPTAIIPFTRTYSYANVYFPIEISLRAGFIPLVSPYIGLGMAGNIRLGGTESTEFNDGTSINTELGGGQASIFVILKSGLEITLTKFRISPEFSLNLNSVPDDINTPNQTEDENLDIHLSIGFYYSP